MDPYLVVEPYLPIKRKKTPSGWISFNAPCCHHRGQSADTRLRGGLIQTQEGITYHCFNCGFTTGWHKGKVLGHKFRHLLSWFGADQSNISKIVLESIKQREDADTAEYKIDIDYTARPLPNDARLVTLQDSEIINYLTSRSLTINDYDFYISEEYPDRVIVPYYYNEDIIGYTTRSVNGSKPKYISNSPAGCVFNLDNQIDKKFAIVVEGPFDAIAIDGMAILSNEVSAKQQYHINRLQIPIIVVPDRDTAGLKLAYQACDLNWSVSFPDWPDENVKDVSDAVNLYGKIFTMIHIMHSVENTPLKIKLRMKSWLKK